MACAQAPALLPLRFRPEASREHGQATSIATVTLRTEREYWLAVLTRRSGPATP